MKHRRPRFYALVRYSPGPRVIHAFRSAKERDLWVHEKSREATFTGEYTVRAIPATDPKAREAYRFSRKFGVSMAYQEH